MNNTDNMDRLLERLQNRMPAIDNPEELTDNIMSTLPDLPEMTDASTKMPTWVIALRTISAMAAMWIVGFFIYVNVPMKSDTNQVSKTTKQEPSQGSTIDIVRTSYLESHNNQLSYTQIKRMIYENR